MNPALEIVFFNAEQDNDIESNANVYLIKSMPTSHYRANSSCAAIPSVQSKMNRCLTIRCFGELSIQFDGEPVVFRTQKADEIIAFLVHNGTTPVHRDVIIDSLWPEMDADRGTNNFHVNTYNIRSVLKGLGMNDLIRQSKGFYYINSSMVDCDCRRFNELAKRFKSDQDLPKELLEEGSEIYAGQYFGINAFPWAVEAQMKYERMYEEIQYRLFDIYTREGQYRKAIRAMRSLIGMDPLAVEAYENIGSNFIVSAFVCKSPHMKFFDHKILSLNNYECQCLYRAVEHSLLFLGEGDPMGYKTLNHTNMPFGTPQLLQSCLEQMLISLYQRGDSLKIQHRIDTFTQQNNYNQMAEMVKFYLDEHIDKLLKLEDIANALRCSVPQMKKLFHVHCGKGIIDYFIDLKISEAKRLVTEGKYNFSQIAAMLGYENTSYFSKLFKERTDMTLTEYARSIGK
jgi:AraC-like DNA-binding protein/DNA-binding winged helix-turn-helix (wHTH) protein